MTTMTAAMSGIDAIAVLASYGALCVVVAIWGAWELRALLGPRGRDRDPLPDLDAYKLALIGGGPQLAITAAATKLHQDGVVRAAEGNTTLEVAGRLEAGADRLEREVFDSISAQPGLDTRTMRAQVADSEPIRWMTSDLTSAGLLLDPEARSALATRLTVAGGALAMLGLVPIALGAATSAARAVLAGMIFVVVAATFTAVRGLPTASRRGSEIVRRHRKARASLRRTPMAGEGVMAAALFGGPALWLAEPAIASSLGVPREAERGGGGGGAASGGAGGCSSAGSCGSSSGFGGGGGCGGGGGGGCGGGGS